MNEIIENIQNINESMHGSKKVAFLSYDYDEETMSGKMFSSLYNSLNISNKIMTDNINDVIAYLPDYIITQQWAILATITSVDLLNTIKIVWSHAPGQINNCTKENTDLILYDFEDIRIIDNKLDIPSLILDPPIGVGEIKLTDKNINDISEYIDNGKASNKNTITIIFFSTSRYEYLIPMMKSFHKNVDTTGFNIHTILVDDYPLRRNKEVVNLVAEVYNIDKVIMHETNLGYSETWKRAWSEYIPAQGATDYVFHMEEDFVFNERISLKHLVSILNNDNRLLYQISLKRNLFYSNSSDFIRNIQENTIGTEESICDISLVLHNELFNANPCIYPYWITQEKYEYNPQEGTILYRLNKKFEGCCALYGARACDPQITHIGEYNQGQKILPDEPGWDWLKDYNPTKQYYSNKHLTIYGNPDLNP